MSHNKPHFACDQDDTALLPEQNLNDAVSQINKHAANLQSQPFDAQNVSQYVCDLLAELSIIASRANLVFLTYLIDVAHEEARLQSRTPDQPYL